MASINRTSSLDSVTVHGDEEKQDQLHHIQETSSEKSSDTDPLVVSFDGPDDPENPLNWSRKYKWFVIGLVSAANLMTNLGTLMCTPAVPLMQKDLHSADNAFYSVLLVSIWELGEACGPLLIAPLSEYFGRYPVYHVANIGFVVCSIISGASVNTQMLIAFRFFNGLSVASVTLNAAIVGDLFVLEEQGKAQSLAGLLPLIGPIFGPTIGGYISQAIGWRWMFWFMAILTALVELGFLLGFRETYKMTILRRKTKRLRKETGNDLLRPEIDRPAGTKLFFQQSIVRPITMLLFSPAVLLLAVYVSVVFAYYYILLTTSTQVFERNYGWSTGTASLIYIGIGLGMVLGVFCCKYTLDRYVKRMESRHSMQPEQRLVPMVISGFVIPAGLIWYGWTAEKQLHWILPIFGLALCGFSIAATIIPSYSYLVHAFGMHSASAIAGVITLRCVTGVVLPLAGPALFARLGLGWGSTLLAFIAIGFLPVPLILMRVGKRIRDNSRLAKTS